MPPPAAEQVLPVPAPPAAAAPTLPPAEVQELPVPPPPPPAAALPTEAHSLVAGKLAEAQELGLAASPAGVEARPDGPQAAPPVASPAGVEAQPDGPQAAPPSALSEAGAGPPAPLLAVVQFPPADNAQVASGPAAADSKGTGATSEGSEACLDEWLALEPLAATQQGLAESMSPHLD